MAAGSRARLTIDYTGMLNDKMAGFYRSSYTSGSKTKYVASTQFEATDARRAFPCWDEPSAKATFSISLQIPEPMVALSNMDIKAVAVDHKSKSKIVSFKKTPIMSTYLVAWAVGELDDGGKVETTRDGVQVRVWATKGTLAESGDFARQFAAKTLDFFTEYFGVKYPLPKMDMLAVPDFAAGAMENWGLVTYRATYVLFDPKKSSLKTKQAVASVVGHELAHQWFGNLVTMEWWSDLWLNEGFASWVGQLAVDKQHPEWNVWTETVVHDCQAGLGLDSLRTSHPIEVAVKSPSEISQIFDSISYSKGSSIIRMLVQWLGEDVFKRGIQAYLKKYQYGNARTDDLWSSLSEASGVSNVNEMMSGWTRHVGYPVLDVSSGSTPGSLLIGQRRFLSSGDVQSLEDKMVWTVPLFPQNGSSTLVLDQKQCTFADLRSSCLKLNSGQYGFYRVNYPSDWIESLGAAIERGAIADPVDRIGLISDTHSLAVSGDRTLVDFLDLATKFTDESDYFVWDELLTRLQAVCALLWQNGNLYEQARGLIRTLTWKKASELGFDAKDGESDLRLLLRQRILSIAGLCGNENVIEEAKRRFERLRSGDESAVHPNLKGTIYGIVVREGGQSEYDSVLSLYKTLEIADQKLAALGALGASKNQQIIRQALDLSKDTAIVRPMDVIYIFRAVGGNSYGRLMCWSFVKDNWELFYNRYQKGGFSLLSRIVTSCTDGFTRDEDAIEIESFFAGASDGTDSRQEQAKSIERALEQSLERIRTNARCLNRNIDKLTLWFSENMPILLKKLH